MSHQPSETRPRVTLPQLHTWHQADRKLVMLTAYDSATALLADAAGVDIIFFGGYRVEADAPGQIHRTAQTGNQYICQ